LLFESDFIGLARDGTLKFRHGGLDGLHGLGRKNIALMAKDFVDMLMHGRGVANRPRTKPLERHAFSTSMNAS
jgi:hypothetical protein